MGLVVVLEDGLEVSDEDVHRFTLGVTEDGLGAIYWNQWRDCVLLLV